MKHLIRLFFTAALLPAVTGLFAQRQADWSVNLTGNAQQIILQQLTGVPIVQTDKAYIGIDPATQKVAWTAERKNSKLAAALLNVESFDFHNMAGSPFVLISNNVLDARTGAAVISKKETGYKRVEDYEIIPTLNSVLVRVTAPNGMMRLYLIGMADSKVKWATDVMKPAQITGLDEAPSEDRPDVPLYTTLAAPDGSLVFRYQKSLAVISPEGKLLWIEKANPAEVMLSPDGKTVLAVDALVTGVGNSPVPVRYGIKYRSSKISAYDLKTGKPAWKTGIDAPQNIRWADAHPDFLTVVWGKGCNLYNYATGRAEWAENFNGKQVVEVTPNEEGFLVVFESGLKSMQLDKNGKPRWKEPREILAQDDERDDALPEDGLLDVYEYANGRVLVDTEKVRFKPVKGSDLKKWKMTLTPSDRVAFDDSLGNLLLLQRNELHIVNPDRNPAIVKSFKINFRDISGFHTLEFRPKGYFMTSSEEFVAFNLAAETAVHRYYARPADVGGALLGLVNLDVDLGLVGVSTYGARSGFGAARWSRPGWGNTVAGGNNNRVVTADVLGFTTTFMPSGRSEAFRSSRDFAWYFTRKGADNVLVKINKDSGEETDQLILEGARPIYQVDEVQKRVYFCKGDLLKVFEM